MNERSKGFHYCFFLLLSVSSLTYLTNNGIFSDRKKAVKIAHNEISKNNKLEKELRAAKQQEARDHELGYHEEMHPLFENGVTSPVGPCDSRYVVRETVPLHEYRHHRN